MMSDKPYTLKQFVDDHGWTLLRCWPEKRKIMVDKPGEFSPALVTVPDDIPISEWERVEE